MGYFDLKIALDLNVACILKTWKPACSGMIFKGEGGEGRVFWGTYLHFGRGILRGRRVVLGVARSNRTGLWRVK